MPACANIAQIDNHARQLREAAHQLEQRASHLPTSRAERLRLNATKLHARQTTPRPAHHHPGDDSMTPALDERAHIRAAMDRILAGDPQHSNGALTIVALAQEAQVPRNARTQRHPDLKNDFYAKVKERGQPTDSERRLRKKITKLKELRAAGKEQLTQLETDIENLVRVVNQLTLENRQLRQQLATPGPVVRLLPAQPQPPGR